MIYKFETVRLLREVQGVEVPRDSEGTVLEVERAEDGHPLGAVVAFRFDGTSINAKVPFDALELVISSTGGCTGAFWGLTRTPAEIVEGAMHAALDHGHEMREGLNMQRLRYDAQERFWQREEKKNDRTGAHIVAEAPGWDGCVVAFSGRERLHLEFRLHGRCGPYVLMHQRYEALEEQRRATGPAMSLMRLMFEIYAATGAEYTAMPVADLWIDNESLLSLLKPPYFPDLLIVPQTAVPEAMPELFRMARLHSGRAIMTSLPVKFSPTEAGFERTEMELKLNRMRACEALGEKAYDELYEARTSRSASTLYSDAKDAFYDAIGLARDLGLTDEAERLDQRLEHIKAVFRSQFS